MRSTASLALHVLRAIEDALARSATHNILVRARSEVALYVLNHKRGNLRDIEQRFGVAVIVAADDTLTGTTYHAIERGELASPPAVIQRSESVRIDSVAPAPEYDEPVEDEAAEDEEPLGAEETGVDGAEGSRESSDQQKRRRRRRRRGRGEREGGFQPGNAPQPPDAGLEFMAQIGGDLPASYADTTMSDGEVDETEAEAFEADVTGEPGVPTEGGQREHRSRRGGARRRRGGERGEPRNWEPREQPAFEQPTELAVMASDDHAPVAEYRAPVHAEVHEPAAHVEAEHTPTPVAVAAEPAVAEAPRARGFRRGADRRPTAYSGSW